MEQSVLSREVSKIFTHGIACQALITLDGLGILKDLIENPISPQDYFQLPDEKCHQVQLEASLVALSYAEIVAYKNHQYTLTLLGYSLLKSIDEFRLWFGAYGKLMGQIKLGDGVHRAHEMINGGLVANASAGIGKRCVDPYLMELIDSLPLLGGVCDLGCGNGQRLSKLCQRVKTHGLGIDQCSDAIEFAIEQAILNEDLVIDFKCADVTQLYDVYPSIDVIMQTFMTHHIAPEMHCVNVIVSYKKQFPNARYFLVLDTVAPDEIGSQPEIFSPGFLYVHGLQGLKIRRKSELLNIFQLANVPVLKEIKLDVPNSFIWLLSLR